ncbi:MAG: hypothetical protein LQ352_005388 [Teloschistes flavicans]|nr:MAG: hypothetical protein LQ352_005388 [Teloschistes flavicans]
MAPEKGTLEWYRDQCEKAEQERDAYKGELDSYKGRLVPLNFFDLLTICHNECGDVPVETDPRRCTKGTVADARAKYIPIAVAAWKDFSSLQQALFSDITTIYHKNNQPPESFPNHNFVSGLGSRSNKISSENGLRAHQLFYVETFVQDVVKDLISKGDLPPHFKLGDDIFVEGHANYLNIDEEKGRIAGQADQIFVKKNENGVLRLVFIIEYKPPHKLSLETLKAGLRDFRPNEIANDIVHRIGKEEGDAKDQRDTEATVVMVLTQVYHYMLTSGCQYAYLSTGVAFVFLHIQEDDWTTLLYHLHVPHESVIDGGGFDIQETAIAKVLTFHILACQAGLQDQNAIQANQRAAPRWVREDGKLLVKIPQTPSPPDAPQPSEYIPSPGRADQSPDRPKMRLRPRPSVAGETPALAFRPKEDSDSDDPSPRGGSRQKPSGFSGSTNKHSSTSGGSKSSQATKPTGQTTTGSSRKRPEGYCSHQCLQGLATKGPLDPLCPNYECHPSKKRGVGIGRHTINDVEMRERLVVQVIADMNNNIEPLGIQGARGAIFRITLASHGYTMIGKGTPEHYVHHLRHELAVYQHLCELQGDIIPVCLGAIDSPRCYYYSFGPVEIYHWLLMSFAGVEIEFEETEAGKQRSRISEMQEALLSRKVVHRDVRAPNILWDERTEKWMLVDFERSYLIRGKQIFDGEQDEKVEERKVPLTATSPSNQLLGKRKARSDKESAVDSLEKIQMTGLPKTQAPTLPTSVV